MFVELWINVRMLCMMAVGLGRPWQLVGQSEATADFVRAVPTREPQFSGESIEGHRSNNNAKNCVMHPISECVIRCVSCIVGEACDV